MKRLFILYGLLVLTACQKKEAVPFALKTNKDSVTKQEKPIVPPAKPEIRKPEIGVLVGIVSGKRIAYDSYKTNDWTTEKFVVYMENGAVKDTLFSLSEVDFSDYYISGAEVLLLQGKPFIYVSSDHTYGHSQGYLYSLDIAKKKAYPVKEEPSSKTYKIPDSLFTGHVTYFGLAKNEDNSFSFGANLHYPNQVAYTYISRCKVVAKHNSKYVLRTYERTLSDENGNIIKIK